MTITGSPPSAAELTAELRMPPAVVEWIAEQDAAPAPPRPTGPGCHRLGEWHDLTRLPPGWPFMLPELAALGDDGLYHDAFGVIRPVTNSGVRRHAARHSVSS